jgi:hypothetical protein
VLGVAAPQVTGEERLELHRDEAHLRRELAELLAGEEERLGELGAQEYDRLTDQEAVLGAAEGDDVDARVGGGLAKRGALCHGGVGEPGAVDVQVHFELVGGRRDRAGLVDRVDGAELGRLGDRHDARLDRVLVATMGLPATDVIRRQLALGVGDRQQLGLGDALGRAALVDVHVSDVGADDTLEGLGQGVDRGDVRATAVEHREGFRALAEVLAEPLAGAVRVVIVPVGDDVALVGGGEGLEDLGVRA